MSNYWEGFNRYMGVQGVIALVLTFVYAYALLKGIKLDNGYFTIFGAVIGFYFAKNGVGIIDAVRGNKRKGH